MSLDVKLTSSRDQQDIIGLFNRLIVKTASLTGVQRLQRALSAEQSTIDDEHEIDEKVRLVLEIRLETIPDGSLDASALLTEGPFKGKSLLWVAAYIGASRYSCYLETNELVEGYRYFLGQLLPKAVPKTIQFNVAFKHNRFNVSTLWLALYAHLKSQNKDDEWIFDYLLENFTTEELLELDFNELLQDQNGIALSALALVIQADIDIAENHKRNHKDQTSSLLRKISPLQHPEFFNFNAYVVDRDNLGMTALCLAAKGDADNIYKTTISGNSPFISILELADVKALNFKAKILKGKNKGKTPFWYATFMLEKDPACYNLITENVDIEQLDFNDKAEDPNDKSANKSALWYVSHHYAEVTKSRHVEDIFKKVKALNTLDYNNQPTRPKDPNLGKSVLWNLGKAALEGKPRAFTTALAQGMVCDLNYAARAHSGEHADKSVLGFALALAMKGNFKPLKLILRNIKNYPLNPAAIGPFEFEMLCHLAKDHHFYPLEVLLPCTTITPELLNRRVSIDKSGKTVAFLLIELAWAGFPQFLKMALKGIDCNQITLDKKLKTEETSAIMKEMSIIVRDSQSLDMPLLDAFLHSGHEEIAEQLHNINRECTSTVAVVDYQELAEPFATLLTQFEALRITPLHKSKNAKRSPKGPCQIRMQ
ncbi:MAG: hypothetical protein AB7I18_03965 [Candidatus Berkiella sp.]